eukprot:CAMPEP_0206541760 /NCGR_PEP_ID=MMETSP0325_2-20121206/9793_1 /ASSEMBLY_ACC=CAM_ASM_000347 /TAXON_ID=2866 /ORGANISM="Crypthecodinium cohnii, Strain Seligo" /LENGTH=428 /DNA_ID=CAMNT_0054039737 /DNA_START=14 /DNA_END=1301 /DNA_ORIENTATION=+
MNGSSSSASSSTAPDPAQITWEWLFANTSLHAAGLLDQTSEVSQRGFGEGTDDGEAGVNSSVSILTIRGSRGSTSFIVKRCSKTASHDVVAPNGGTNEKAAFINHFSERFAPDRNAGENEGPLVVPRSYHSQKKPIGENGEGFLLILEKLKGPEWRTLDFEAGCPRDEAFACIRSLGKFHGYFYSEKGMKDLEATSSWLPQTPIRLELADMVQDYYCDAWQQFQKVAPQELLTPQLRSLCEPLRKFYAVLVKRMAQGPSTLVHGDFRLENLRFRHLGQRAETIQVAAFDWQFSSRARGAYDLAYFMGLGLTPRVRAREQDRLKSEYISSVTAAAGESAGALLTQVSNDLEADLCVAILLILASFIIGAATAPDASQAMHWTSIQRISQTALDWQAAGVLPVSEVPSTGAFAKTEAAELPGSPIPHSKL